MNGPGHAPPGNRGNTLVVRQVFAKGWRWLLLILALALAWHSLRGVAWSEAWGFLARFSPVAILVLVAVNLLMLPVMAGRWWLLVRASETPVGLLALCGYRCAANAVSYLTPGPHVGGEPLAVYLLHRRQGIATTSATASVVVDRLLDLAASLVVFLLCILAVTLPGAGPLAASHGPAMGWTVLALVTASLAALFTGKRPVSRLISLALRLVRLEPAAEPFRRGEEMAEALFRRRRLFLLVNLCSVGTWLAVFGEFWLMSYFLGFPLSMGQLTAVVLTARLAFLTPLPAGIGALETALPWLTESLGQGATLGLSLCLLIRFRDLLFSLTGLALTLKYLTCRGKAGIISNIWG